MKRNVIHKFFGVMIIIGFGLLFGAGGASDLGTASFGTCVITGTLGMLLLVVGFKGFSVSGAK